MHLVDSICLSSVIAFGWLLCRVLFCTFEGFCVLFMCRLLALSVICNIKFIRNCHYHFKKMLMVKKPKKKQTQTEKG